MSRQAVMKIVGFSNGQAFDFDLWLESYDVDALPDRRESYFDDTGCAIVNGAFGGVIRLTPRCEDAHRFDSRSEAMLAWNTVSQRRPRRPDGRPNKPLTALTVEIQSA